MTQPNPQFPVDYAGTQTGYYFLPIKARARMAIISLAIVLVFQALYAVVVFLSVPLQEMVATPGTASPATLIVVGGSIVLVSCGSAVASIVAIVFYCLWIYRANHSAHALAGGMEYTPGWSVGWFFIPFANLVKPYYVVKELWQVSNAPPTNPANFRQIAIPGMIITWWLCRLFGGLVSYIGAQVQAHVPGAGYGGAIVTAIGIGMVILSGILCIRIIRQVTDQLEASNPMLVSPPGYFPVAQ